VTSKPSSPAEILREAPAAQRDIPSATLTTEGGERNPDQSPRSQPLEVARGPASSSISGIADGKPVVRLGERVFAPIRTTARSRLRPSALAGGSLRQIFLLALRVVTMRLGAASSSPLLATSAAAEESFHCVVDNRPPTLKLNRAVPFSGLLSEVLVERGAISSPPGRDFALIESGIDAATVELDVLRAESTAQLNSAQTRARPAHEPAGPHPGARGTGVVTNEQVELQSVEVQVAERERDLEVQRRRLAALELDRSRAQLARRTIRALISGYIAARGLSAGEYC